MGHAWGVQEAPYLYNGCSLSRDNYVSMYRWHLPDPIAWRKEARITIQQLAHDGKSLKETPDDWSCPRSGTSRRRAPSPPLPDVKARTANIWPEAKK